MVDEPLFQIIDEAAYKEAQHEAAPTVARKPRAKKSANTDDRTHTGWYKLNHTHFGFCTVPRHNEIQAALNEEQKEFRDKYPTRMLFPIGDYLVCKDCYLAKADLDE